MLRLNLQLVLKEGAALIIRPNFRSACGETVRVDVGADDGARNGHDSATPIAKHERQMSKFHLSLFITVEL